MTQREKEKQMESRLQRAGFDHPSVGVLAEYIVGNEFIVESIVKADDSFIIDCYRATLYVETCLDMQGATMRIANKDMQWPEGTRKGYMDPVEYWYACTNIAPFVRIDEKRYERFRP